MKGSFYFCFYIFVGLILTSCLDDGSQRVTVTAQPGVIEKTDSTTIIHTAVMSIDPTAEKGKFDRNKYDNGDCCIVDFTTDFSILHDPNDSIYSAEILNDALVTKYELGTTLQDTSAILPQELPILELQVGRSILIKEQQFVFTKHNLDSVVIDYNFNLSYNAADLPKIEENGRRVYNLYLRTTKGKEGNKTNEKTRLFTSAYDLSQFIKDKRIEKDTFFYKINYVTELNKDATKITRWNSTLFKILPKK